MILFDERATMLSQHEVHKSCRQAKQNLCCDGDLCWQQMLHIAFSVAAILAETLRGAGEVDDEIEISSLGARRRRRLAAKPYKPKQYSARSKPFLKTLSSKNPASFFTTKNKIRI